MSLAGEPETDAEVVEFCRKQMQELLDRTDFSAPTREGLLDSVGLPHSAVQLIAADLTELGKFDLDLPREVTVGRPKAIVDAARRHWVYRHVDGSIITLQLSQRLKLRAYGYVQAYTFINDTRSHN
jgi:hypothetical protein